MIPGEYDDDFSEPYDDDLFDGTPQRIIDRKRIQELRKKSLLSPKEIDELRNLLMIYGK